MRAVWSSAMWISPPTSQLQSEDSSNLLIMKRTAFTLTELLITLSIVAILMLLSISAAQKVIKSSEKVRCAANLRTISGGVVAFSQDNNGWIPSWFSPSDPGIFWYQQEWYLLIAPYLSGENTIITPLTPHADVINTARIFQDKLHCPSVSLQLYGYQGTLNYAANIFEPVAHQFNKVHFLDISSPSQSIYLTDGYSIFSPQNDGTDHGFPPSSNPPPIGQYIYFPHNGTCNALFLDGHIESFKSSIPKNFLQLWP